MSLEVKFEVGPQAQSAADGTPLVPRLGRTGDTIISELHGRYFEQNYRGRIFSAANQAAQAVSAALATVYTGFCLYNPLNSGKILVPLKAKYALQVAPAAIAPLGMIGGYAASGGVTAQTTKLTIQSSQIGNAASGAGIALSAASIVTPTWVAFFADGFTAAALPAPSGPIDFEGLFSIYPGAFMAVGALTAVTGLGYMSWEEIDQP